MYYSRYGPGLAVIMIVIGIGLIFNSLRGLLTREGMYDRDSTQTMTWASILGVILGVAMLLYGLGYTWRNLDLFSF